MVRGRIKKGKGILVSVEVDLIQNQTESHPIESATNSAQMFLRDFVNVLNIRVLSSKLLNPPFNSHVAVKVHVFNRLTVTTNLWISILHCL